MADSPTLTANGPVFAIIKSAGAAIPDTFMIVSVRTRAETNRIPEAVITMLDGDSSDLEFPITDSDQFKPGTEIEITAGYGDDEGTVIFGGVVVSVRLRLRVGKSHLEVTCRDKAYQLTLGRKSALYAKKKDSDIISAIAGDAGLTVDQEATTEEFPELVQCRATDWDFMLMRAEASGLAINVFNGALAIKKPDATTAAALKVEYGEDLIALDAEIDARDQYASFSAKAWDAATQALVEGTADATAAKDLGNLSSTDLSSAVGSRVQAISTSGPLSEAYLGAVTGARAARAELSKLRGNVRFQGSGLAALGTTLELAGLADRFNGIGLISSVLHIIEDGNWVTEVGLGLKSPMHGDRSDAIDQPGAAGQLPALRSLQIGKVVKLAEDPDGQHRIQISLPLVTGAEDTPIWARYAAPYASTAFGLMMLPEIDDEVVVGFLDDNPTYPIILGSLHNTKAARPVDVADENNNIKVFLSREGLKLEFDEENKKITVLTPGGNSVILDDTASSITIEDMNGNKGVFEAAGITLDSAADINIKATGNITIKATGNLSGGGVNVEMKADASFTGQGGAAAELKGGGTASVSAPLVKIN